MYLFYKVEVEMNIKELLVSLIFLNTWCLMGQKIRSKTLFDQTMEFNGVQIMPIPPKT
jgi:hypothetical protein